MGRADTYEIFPLLTLATASAREIKPLSVDIENTTTHAYAYYFYVSIGNKTYQQLCSWL